MIRAIAGREVRVGLVTPLLWVLLGAGQVVLAWVFLKVVDDFTGLGVDERVASLSVELSLNQFGVAAVIAMLAAPLIAMRMLSAEFRDGSFDLIGAAPVTLFSVVLGKFIGIAILLTPLCLLPVLNLLLLLGL